MHANVRNGCRHSPNIMNKQIFTEPSMGCDAMRGFKKAPWAKREEGRRKLSEMAGWKKGFGKEQGRSFGFMAFFFLGRGFMAFSG